MKNLAVKRFVETKKGNQFEVLLPAVRVVCPRCEGAGKHVNPNIDSHGLSSEDLSDDHFRERYFRGDYDVPCEECKGQNVVLEVDRSQLSSKMLARLRKAERRAWADEQEATWEGRHCS